MRFEQRRGHYMILERNPPLTRGEVNETQYRMLKRCDVPGLLPVELEECDGKLILRYGLAGTRMLSEVMRASHWSMSQMMGALCRLAETLEECRLYLLDADRIRLQDEFIFMGENGQELKLTYVPIDMPTLYRSDDLERLIVRWMMRVKEPEGQVLQQILRIVSSPGFAPSALSRYARRYLSEAIGGVKLQAAAPPEFPRPIDQAMANSVSKPDKPSRSWELLQPVSSAPQSVSELWGDANEANERIDRLLAGTEATRLQSEKAGMDRGRWRIIIACIALFAAAIGWKFVYLSRPGQQSLLLCLCLTLVLGAAVMLLWNGPPGWLGKRERSEDDPSDREIEQSFRSSSAHEDDSEFERWSPPGLVSAAKLPDRRSEGVERDSGPAETIWMAAEDNPTALLAQRSSSLSQPYCLIWKSNGRESRIALQGDSLVIGRSAEVAQHVDDTVGISRAHVELIRISEQWKIKDLGSRNGTKLNDQPMAPYELYALQTGDCLSLADSQYCFEQMER
ncbi:DUF6382 domain-containing protein [Cohnella boryungensis]|uniref:DUF6382 domain-containing protein n=1 Tax=Cohnella boryungensis TaxID=768479 RepID=A0ABV8SCW3_9BACL